MAERTLSLRNPDALRIEDADGRPSRGCDQDWYGDAWQRASGCGPSVASGLLYYLHRTGRVRLPFPVEGKPDCIALMESVWRHVTPSASGVDTVGRFCAGIDGFSRSIGQALDCRSLEIPKKKDGRPALAEVIRFLSAALRRDCPVAFLNLSSGRVRGIEGWHWMTVAALRTGGEPHGSAARMLVYDGSTAVWVDLATWLATSALGGGFVRVDAGA